MSGACLLVSVFYMIYTVVNALLFIRLHRNTVLIGHVKSMTEVSRSLTIKQLWVTESEKRFLHHLSNQTRSWYVVIYSCEINLAAKIARRTLRKNLRIVCLCW